MVLVVEAKKEVGQVVGVAPAMVEVCTAVELVEVMVLGVRLVVEAVLGVVRVVVMVAMCLENTLLTVCMIKNLFLPKVIGKIIFNAARR